MSVDFLLGNAVVLFFVVAGLPILVLALASNRSRGAGAREREDRAPWRYETTDAWGYEETETEKSEEQP